MKKKRRATKKPYSRSIVGATLEVIQKRRTEKPEVRDAAREAALRYAMLIYYASFDKLYRIDYVARVMYLLYCIYAIAMRSSCSSKFWVAFNSESVSVAHTCMYCLVYGNGILYLMKLR